MGWKSALRSAAASARRSEREQERRQRQAARNYKEALKAQIQTESAVLVQKYEAYLALITSVHRQASPPISWNEVVTRAAPTPPPVLATREQAARQALDSYRPGFWARLFRSAGNQRAELERRLANAVTEDEADNQQRTAKYEAELAEWQGMQELGRAVLSGDPQAYIEVLQEFAPWDDMQALGGVLRLRSDAPDRVAADLKILDTDVVPEEEYQLLQNGRISRKKLAKTRAYELYQDYVCGAALRVAREVLALLPVQYVFVTVSGDMLDTSSGHIETQPLLSVLFPRRTIEGLNFDTVDASDSLRNFVHRMDFVKTKGFRPVIPLGPDDLRGLQQR